MRRVFEARHGAPGWPPIGNVLVCGVYLLALAGAPGGLIAAPSDARILSAGPARLPELELPGLEAFWQADLEPGPHAVGFEAFFTIDPTRPYWTRSLGAGEEQRGPHRGRPIRAFVWYPAERESKAPRMTFGEYLDFSDVPSWARVWNENLNLRTRRLLTMTYGTGESIFARLIRQPVLAHAAPPMAPGSHPLIVYSTGSNSHQLENVPLFELLASHGFVVANVPQFDHEWPAMTVGSINSLESRDVQVRDLEFLVVAVRSRFAFVGDNLGAMGFSGGGLYAFLLGMRHAGYLDALVSLDGSLAYGHVRHLEEQPYWDPRRVTFPILNLHKRSDNLDLARLDSFTGSDRYHLNLGDAYHLSFTQLPLVNSLNPESQTYYEGDELADARSRYLTLCRTVVLFARAYLLNDARARAQLDAFVDSAPGTTAMESARFVRGSPVPTEDEIIAALLAGDADSTIERMRRLEVDDAVGWDIERLVRRVRVDLGWFQRHEESVAVLQALLRWRPLSARILAQLVEAELKLGRGEEARLALDRLHAALSADPELDEETRRELQKKADEMLQEIAPAAVPE